MGFCVTLLGASPSRKGCWVCSSPWLSFPRACCAPGHGLPKPTSCLVPSQGRCLILSLPLRMFKPGWVLGSAGTEGGWCWWPGRLRQWYWCTCRGGTCHPHCGPPALPAAPAGAPRPGRCPRPHGSAPWPAWSVALGTWWEAWPCIPAWWWVLGAIPAPPWGWHPRQHGRGSGLSGAGWGLTTPGWERRGWVTLALRPRLLQQGRALSIHSSCPKVGMLSPGEYTNSPWNQKSLLLEVLFENCLSFFWFV